jgi:hypothetical protein
MILSGCSASARATPGWPGRGFFGRSGRFGFWPFDGGRLELSGVLGGPPSRASSAVIRAVSATICACCARIRATKSSLGRARRVSRFTDTVNRNLRYRVKQNHRAATRKPRSDRQEGGVSNYFMHAFAYVGDSVAATTSDCAKNSLRRYSCCVKICSVPFQLRQNILLGNWTLTMPSLTTIW